MSDHNLRDIASRCEAKLHGFRRTADGVVVSFVLHPAEVPPVLALDPLGTRYMLAFVAIGDDEQPMSSSPREDQEFAAAVTRHKASPHDAGERPLSVTRPAQQGVIHPPCEETPGATWATLGHSPPNVLTPKARYAAMTAGEQAVQRAGMLSSDLRFRAWAGCSDEALTEDQAADYIRGVCCYGKSRTLIAEDPEALDKFIDLETRFLIDVGQIAGPR